jgi:putative oxidoreductase
MEMSTNFFDVWSGRLLSVLRIVVAGLFVQHGTAKLFHIPYMAQFDHVQLMSLSGIAGVIEIIFGLLVLVGLFTRFAAFILSGEMAVGYFIAHAPHGVLPITNQGELAAIYCWVFLFFALAGGGPWSLDARREHGLTFGHPAHRTLGHESS